MKVVKYVFLDWFIFPGNQKVFCRIWKYWQFWYTSMFRHYHIYKTTDTINTPCYWARCSNISHFKLTLNINSFNIHFISFDLFQMIAKLV